jgi:hypothetical protein
MSEAKAADSPDLNTETLMGDLRGAILDRLRAMPKPWTVMNEREQADMIEGVDRVSRHLVAQAVRLIAANGHATIPATLVQCAMKDGIKVVLEVSKFDQQRHQLMDAVVAGAAAHIVLADAEPFMGEREPVKPDPDQPAMPGMEGDNVKPIRSRKPSRDDPE